MREKPRSRRTPHKHIVHTKHSRYKVSSYERGKGDKPSQRAKRQRKSIPAIRPRKSKPKVKAVSGGGFGVRIEYTDRSFEHVDVTANDYTGALDGGIETRKKLRIPAMIRLRRR